MMQLQGIRERGGRVVESTNANAPWLLHLPADRYLVTVLGALGFVALAGAPLMDFLPGSDPGFGRSQVALSAAGALMMSASGTLAVAAGRLPGGALDRLAGWVDDLLRLAPLVIEVGAIVLVLRWFRIESPIFHQDLAFLVFVGFVIHHALPLRARLPFFALLSIAGVVTVFGFVAAKWLLGIGLVLMGTCHLPIRFAHRVALLLAAGVLLAVLRADLVRSPVPPVIWPILGSMFMFRLVLYMYELRHAREPMGVARTLGYFFLLPNVAFPLFPVVDFATFRRTWYDRPARAIYQSGVHWMLLGITHLLGYRIVYQHFTMPVAGVSGGLDLVRYSISTFLLYLKVSGQFHLIVGMLHLFGFRLPESHRFFYMASSFTDLWRRINIYWKDFMMKVFYYPLYFRMRKRGDTFALVVSTLFVFISTWALHSYQWFWLLGSVLLSWPDALFWAMLAGLLIVNTLHESRRGRARSLGNASPPLTLSVRHGFAVVGTFSVMCTLWSLWSSPSIDAWVRMWLAAELGAREIAVAGASLMALALVVAAGHQALARVRSGLPDGPPQTRGRSALILNTTWLAALIVLGNPDLTPRLGNWSQEFTRDLRVDKLNEADAALLHRGYYENLTSVNQFNSRLWDTYARRPNEWRQIWETEAVRQTTDFLKWEVTPLVGFMFNGTTIRTNRWGMRDRDYEMVPPPGTYRIALSGSSFAMGQGVNDHETFEHIVEERLNAESTVRAMRFEILNFSVPAYTPIEQLLLLEKTILTFSPDAFLFVGHPYDTENSGRHTANMFLQGVEMPYAYLDSLVAAAGLSGEMTLDEASERMWRAPFKQDLVTWALRRIVEVCRQRGIDPVWAYLSTPGVVIDEEAEGLVTAARDAGFLVLDIRDAYGGHSDSDLAVAPWDSHPNAFAHRLIADRLYRALVGEGVLEELLANR
jgi:hypothetical protein